MQIVRDASGWIVSRTMDPAGSAPAVTTKYLQAAGGDVAWGQKIAEGTVNSVNWLFTRSPTTDRVGPSGPLAECLTKNGITWQVVP